MPYELDALFEASKQDKAHEHVCRNCGGVFMRMDRKSPTLCKSCHVSYQRAWQRKKRGCDTPNGEKIHCVKCDAVIVKYGMSKFCKPCRALEEKVYSKRYRDSKAKPPRVSTCVRCNVATFPNPRGMRLYCSDCKRATRLAQLALRASRLARRAKVPLGSSVPCADCGCSIIKTVGSRKFCVPCADVRSKLNEKRSRNKHIQTDTYKRRVAGYRNQPVYKISSRMRSAIKRGLILGKRGHTFDLLGYSPDALRSHLERQFRGRMSWKNMGKWHIDHIIPLSSFNYESPDDPDFKAAWALSNLRPLWAKENLSKNAKRTHLL